MRRLAFVLFGAFVFMVFMAQEASAIQVTLATKQITVNFNVTPSPVAYLPANSAIATSLAQIDRSIAYEPFRLNDSVAAVATPESSVKVQFSVKPDPTFAYFHITPGAGGLNLNAGYGTNTYSCVFTVFAHYTTAWVVADYTYGSNTSGGTAGFNGFPVYNYPTTSDLDWLAETVTTTFKPYHNSGSPGETTFTGTAGSTKTICIDLQLTVPNTIPAGSYSATLSYVMTHS